MTSAVTFPSRRPTKNKKIKYHQRSLHGVSVTQSNIGNFVSIPISLRNSSIRNSVLYSSLTDKHTPKYVKSLLTTLAGSLNDVLEESNPCDFFSEAIA